MYPLQSVKHNHLLNSEIVVVILDYVAATQIDTVSFSKNLFTNCAKDII